MTYLMPFVFILIGMGIAEMCHIALYHYHNKLVNKKTLQKLYDKGYTTDQVVHQLDVTQYEVMRCWYHNDSFYADRTRTDSMLGKI